MGIERGYRGSILMESPTGERRTVQIPGRIATEYDPITAWRTNKKHIALTTSWMNDEEKKKRIRLDQAFNRLLLAGWKVVKSSSDLQDGTHDNDNASEDEEKKNTDTVIGTTLSGDKSHGGNHASGEVADSPNRAQRGCRGGRSKNSKSDRIQQKKESDQEKKQAAYPMKQYGGSGIYAPQRMRISSESIASMESSAELLKKIIGQSEIKMPQGIEIDSKKLLIALETGDNPIPPLEIPHEVPRIRVIVTPDCSGSTQSWSGVGAGWAHHLSRISDIEVVYVENMNGDFIWKNYGKPPKSVADFLQDADMIIYLGDGDGHDLCHSYAEKGARVIALDCHLSSVAKPRLNELSRKTSGGELYWVDRVSAKDPMTWYKALELVLSA